MTEIKVPHDWLPRPYQEPLWDALAGGCKRAVAVWHRRAGKDSVGLNWTVREALSGRVGVYWHLLPTLRQGRRVVWDGITGDGRRFLDHWPNDAVAHRRNDEMKFELVNGSIWQVVGSDNYDALVGANPVGVVMSEYALQGPAAWNYLRPILAENGGWAVFLYTPRGHNHGYALYNMAKGEPDWFAQKLTRDDTEAISLEAVEAERRSGMSNEMIEQEFFCSFEAPLHGSYYGHEMMEAERDHRITHVPHDVAAGVETWWDLGIGDATAIWFAQRVGQEIHLIDYHEETGKGLAHYASVLQAKREERSMVYADHVFPHDVRARELGTGKSRAEVLEDLNVEVTIAPDLHVNDGIEASRAILPRCWFDEKRCERGIEALRQYRKDEDENRGRTDGTGALMPYFKAKPRHDWASHGADAFRYGAVYRPTPSTWGQPIEQPEVAIV